ncbi:MAG: helix-turn-helix transcriptional regulator, partial [Chloroflexota bacterium]
MTRTHYPRMLQALRSKLNLSQEQLASRLNVSFATINRWESGKSQPQRSKAQAIEDLYEEAGLDGTEAGSTSEPSRQRRGVRHSAVLG